MTISAALSPWYVPYTPFGMGLTYTTTTTMAVAAGTTPDSTYQNIITISSPVLISLAVTGAGGIDTGVLTASTLYNVFAIGSSNNPPANPGGIVGPDYTTPYSANPGSALLSASTTPTLPAGYDMYRYIGCVVINSSSQFALFNQSGNGGYRTMWYDTAISVLSGGTSATYANVNMSTAVPRPGLVALLKVSVTPTGAGNEVDLIPYGSSATNGYLTVSGSVASVAQIVNPLQMLTGSNSGVAYIQYKVTGSTTLSVQGYVDQL